MTEKPTLICDIETYRDYFLIAFKRVSDGKVLSIEMSSRTDRADDQKKRDRVRAILLQNQIITYNGLGYDIPMIWYFVCGATNAELKQASDRIINGNVRYWEVEDLLGIRVPKLSHIDLMEPQPNAFASLKTLNGRLHGKKMQDLPIEPDARLTSDDMDLLTKYCSNDLDATELLFHALKEPLELREELSKLYNIDLRSKSDAQMGEGIIKKRVEAITGERAQRAEVAPGTSFRYPVPDYLAFENPELREIVERLRETDFYIKSDGKVEMPPFLHNKKLTIGETTYAMGIGGLHSTEANRSVYSDNDHVLIDFDVSFYYPSIIIASRLYPKSLGRPFLDAFGTLKTDKARAKARAKEIRALSPAAREALAAELRREDANEKGTKIQGNGSFGKLGSRYSILYAPHLLITVTLTGQLAILMLIDRAKSAGIPAVSANTDGVVFRCPRDREADMLEITRQWERDTGFDLDATPYRSLHSLSVNTYIAVKEDGKAKRKGTLANPRAEGDMRTQLMVNPSMNVCSDAVVALITRGTPIEQTIRACTDVRDFLTVVKVQGGGTWRGDYLGKVVRYVWSTDGDEILYKDPHPTTGNYKRVSKSDGCRPIMELPDELPADIDYFRYIAEAHEILMDIGYHTRPALVKPIRIYKKNAIAWFALAA